MRFRPLLLTAASCAAALTIAGCNREPETINAGPADAQEEALRNAAPAPLPPSIAESRSYRCKDGGVISVDFMSDQTTAVFRADKDATPVVLTAPEAGKPFAGSDYSVSGSGKVVTVKAPGKGSQECEA